MLEDVKKLMGEKDRAAREAAGHYSDYSFSQLKWMGNPYAYDDGYVVPERQRVLGGMGDKAYDSLREAYVSRIGALQEAHPDRFMPGEDQEAYLQEVYGLQESMGFYPELDPNMDEAIRQEVQDLYLGMTPEQADWAQQNPDSLKPALFAAAQDNLGYVKYDENREPPVSQEQSAAREEYVNFGDGREAEEAPERSEDHAETGKQEQQDNDIEFLDFGGADEGNREPGQEQNRSEELRY